MSYLTLKKQPNLGKTNTCGTPTGHNRNAEWLREVKNKLKDLERQRKISISLEDKWESP